MRAPQRRGDILDAADGTHAFESDFVHIFHAALLADGRIGALPSEERADSGEPKAASLVQPDAAGPRREHRRSDPFDVLRWNEYRNLDLVAGGITLWMYRPNQLGSA